MKSSHCIKFSVLITVKACPKKELSEPKSYILHKHWQIVLKQNMNCFMGKLDLVLVIIARNTEFRLRNTTIQTCNLKITSIKI